MTADKRDIQALLKGSIDRRWLTVSAGAAGIAVRTLGGLPASTQVRVAAAQGEPTQGGTIT